MQNPTFLKRHTDLSAGVSSRILLCGKSFIADPTGALYWPAENALVVSDLHLEKGSHLTEDGVRLPSYDTRSSFEKIEEAIDRYNPLRVVALGDNFCGGVRLSIGDLDWLGDLMAEREWIWVTGESGQPVPEPVGGAVRPHFSLGGVRFRYEPTRAPVGHEIAGRLHPVAKISEYGHIVRARCYVSNGLRLILPSLGAYSSGLNVLDDSFTHLLGRDGLFVWILMNGRVYPVAAGQLVEE
jgi:uncharacterized protein